MERALERLEGNFDAMLSNLDPDTVQRNIDYLSKSGRCYSFNRSGEIATGRDE